MNFKKFNQSYNGTVRLLSPRFLDLRMCSVKFLKEVFCLSIP